MICRRIERVSGRLDVSTTTLLMRDRDDRILARQIAPVFSCDVSHAFDAQKHKVRVVPIEKGKSGDDGSLPRQKRAETEPSALADSDWQARERRGIRKPENPAKRSFVEKTRQKPLRLPELIVIYFKI
jgi:hypothetical protein